MHEGLWDAHKPDLLISFLVVCIRSVFRALLLSMCSHRDRAEYVKIKIKHMGDKFYQNEFITVTDTYELTRDDVKDMWIRMDLGDMEELTDEEVQIKLQAEIDTELSKWERNIMARGRTKRDHSLANNCRTTGDGSELMADQKTPDAMAKDQDYQEACQRLHALLPKKPEWADIVIAKVLDGETFVSIGKRTGQSEDSIRKKYKRAIARLEKVYPKTSGFEASHAVSLKGDCDE